MTRVCTDMTGWTEEQKTEHRRAKNRAKSQKWRSKNTEKHREQVKEWQANNPEKIESYQATRNARHEDRYQNDTEYRERRRETWRNWAREHQDERDAYKYLRMYGITYEQRDAMFDAQGKCCAICKGTDPRGINWHTDHCHKTNKVRGLLCSNCNTLLGLSGDSATVLRAAAAYLECG